MINSSVEGGSLKRMLIISECGPKVMPRMESAYKYARHPLETQRKISQELHLQPVSLRPARTTARSPIKCYTLFGGD